MATDEERLDSVGRSALSAARGGMPAAAKRAVRDRVMFAARSDTRRRAWVLVSRRAAFAFAITAALSSGVAYAAGNSLPGDLLYPVKRASESVAVALLPDGALQDGVLHAVAERRAVEAVRLAQHGVESGVFDHAMSELRDAMETAFPAGEGLPEREIERLRDRAEDVPAPQREQIESAIGAPSTSGNGEPAPDPAPEPEPQPDPGPQGGQDSGSGQGGSGTQSPRGPGAP
jgi:hypothetical protein